ncbi:helix-turn-helix transcriptional regulator [Actinosynnema sp. ALI-1.44]|uniref:helix-turn-helix transcriptional regulator n=1 Tax=Actinosynnema sp. ALI-1.44 TaxID=1933779 RepID=UPI00143D870F|nr:helix-turn-helix transcriptional regulator [Actinosynnema sp. ALI-1.44]
MTRDGAAAEEKPVPAAARLSYEIRRQRKAAGLSQPQLADKVGYTRQYVSLAERVGRNIPSRELVAAIDKAVVANGKLIELRQRAKAEQAALRQSSRPHPVDRRSLLAAGGATAFDTVLSSRTRVLEALEIVTSGDADTLKVAVGCLDELIAHHAEKLPVSPMVDMYGDLLNLRSYAGDLMRRSGTSARRRTDLTTAAGRLSNLLAVVTSYLGDDESTLIWCLDAERRGHESGCHEVNGWAALTRATSAYYQGDAKRSIEYAVQGQRTAPAGTAAHAKLAAHEMRAHATLGDVRGMTQARHRAAQVMTELPASVATTGAFSIARSEDPPYTATSLLHLNQFGEAASATRAVIETAYPTTRHVHHEKSSSYGRTLLILALAEAGLGRVDEAVVAGRTALEGSGSTWPTLVLAGKLDRVLWSRHKNSAEVSDYHDRYLAASNAFGQRR